MIVAGAHGFLIVVVVVKGHAGVPRVTLSAPV